jgi:transcriptional regulator with XRE-family HTH domain
LERRPQKGQFNSTEMPSPREDSPEAIAERLKALRIAMGYSSNQSGFARYLGMTQQAWSNYERAIRRIDLDSALAVVKGTGVTLDWIYRGVGYGLPRDLAALLAEVEPRQPKRA